MLEMEHGHNRNGYQRNGCVLNTLIVYTKNAGMQERVPYRTDVNKSDIQQDEKVDCLITIFSDNSVKSASVLIISPAHNGNPSLINKSAGAYNTSVVINNFQRTGAQSPPLPVSSDVNCPTFCIRSA